jgi:hypothetical protein
MKVECLVEMKAVLSVDQWAPVLVEVKVECLVEE